MQKWVGSAKINNGFFNNQEIAAQFKEKQEPVTGSGLLYS